MSHYVCELSSIKYENIYMPEEGKMSAVCVCVFFFQKRVNAAVTHNFNYMLSFHQVERVEYWLSTTQ